MANMLKKAVRAARKAVDPTGIASKAGDMAKKMYQDVTSPNVKKMVGEDMKRGLREPGAMKDMVRSRLRGQVGKQYRGM